MIVRDATEADLPAITAIYGREVETGSGTFEYAAPPQAEMAARMAAVRRLGLPWLVCEIDGKVAGYGLAGAFRPRTGYRFAVEDSVYVDASARGRGVGRAILAQLISRCEALGMRQMLAVIGDSGNAGSIALHRAAGFREAGVFRSVGFKHGRWIDVVFMQRALGSGDEARPDADGLSIGEVWVR